MRGRALRRGWPFALWLVVLALLPWWLGLPLLLGIAAALLTGAERLHAFHGTLRLALRWGVPGVALALARGSQGGVRRVAERVEAAAAVERLAEADGFVIRRACAGRGERRAGLQVGAANVGGDHDARQVAAPGLVDQGVGGGDTGAGGLHARVLVERQRGGFAQAEGVRGQRGGEQGDERELGQGLHVLCFRDAACPALRRPCRKV